MLVDQSLVTLVNLHNHHSVDFMDGLVGFND